MTKTEFWRETRALVLIASSILLMFWTWDRTTDFVMRTLWMDLTSVTVPDHKVGDDPIVTINREIKQDGVRLFSTVTLRRSKDLRHVCTGRSPGAFSYYLEANSRDSETGDIPSMTIRLSHWMWSNRIFEECASTGLFGEGKFYVETCYLRYLLGFVPFESCVRSNDFWRTE